MFLTMCEQIRIVAQESRSNSLMLISDGRWTLDDVGRHKLRIDWQADDEGSEEHLPILLERIDLKGDRMIGNSDATPSEERGCDKDEEGHLHHSA